jgi:hypothetical protein
MKPVVNILVSIPDPKFFKSCTLCFDTLRVGFPTADIRVFLNSGLINVDGAGQEKLESMIANARGLNGYTAVTSRTLHLAEWIGWRIQEHAKTDSGAPLIILDADTCFWKSCEDWVFPSETLMAGYYNPYMWNDFAQCPSFPRIHTSFMVFPDTGRLLERIRRAYPNSYEQAGDYCPCDPFTNTVRFINGKPYFWDCCANLYSMLHSEDIATTYQFCQCHKDCYEHLNSASFFKVMHERLENKAGFELLHTQGAEHPELLRGKLWPLVDAYYLQKSIEAELKMPVIQP